MKILQLISPSKISGAERVTAELCGHLQAAGHRVTIGCKQASPLIDVMRDAGLDAHPLPLSGKLNALAPFRVVQFARQLGAEVIHTHLSSAAWHGSLAGRLAGLPTVSHVHALNSPFCFRLATRVIAVSHAVKRHLIEQGMNGNRIDVVYLGVDPSKYYLPCDRSVARAKLGLPHDGVLVGIVAHLTAKKGHAVFLEAFAQIAARHPQARALFLGDGEEKGALLARAAKLRLAERVIFAGFQPNVLPYYAALDAVVLPSIDGEGLPRCLLEAGLLRLPTIGTRLSGVPELIRDGETGFVVPVGDEETLAECLNALLGDAALREQMGQAGHEFISSTFTVPAMLAGILATYEKAGAAPHSDHPLAKAG